MTIYENKKNREQQNIAMFQLERHLNKLGIPQISIVATEERQRLPYDGRMFVNGMFTSVVEVKSRNVDSDTVRKWGSIIVEIERLAKMKQEFYNGRWNKEVIFLFRCTKDHQCFAIHIKEIVRLWDELVDAEPEMMKDNQGTQFADKKGKLIPIHHMETFQ